jgi:hypothetical protein
METGRLEVPLVLVVLHALLALTRIPIKYLSAVAWKTKTAGEIAPLWEITQGKIAILY